MSKVTPGSIGLTNQHKPKKGITFVLIQTYRNGNANNND